MRFTILALLSCASVNALPGEVAPDKRGRRQAMGGDTPHRKVEDQVL